MNKNKDNFKIKKSFSKEPAVTIGIPSYEREKMLISKIKNLKNQTYKKIKIVISCNSKLSKQTKEKIKKILKKNKFVLIQQKKNLGPWNNFLFVLQKATSPLFMWASDDDYHHPKFIENLVGRPFKKGACILAMSGFENVNAHGRKYRKVKQIWEYFGKSNTIQASKVIEDPELYGKANFIYGIWDTAFLKKICANLDDHVCVDQAIVTAGLLSKKVRFSRKILFKKYNYFEKGTQNIDFQNPEKGYFFRLLGDRIYQRNLLKVLWLTKTPSHFLFFVRRLFLEAFAK